MYNAYLIMRKTILVFDVDGVLTNPQSKKISQIKILEYITNNLRDNHKIAFNTGRSAEWLEKKVIKPVKEMVFKKEKNYFSLKNLISICEMGNVVINYGNNGESIKEILNKNTIPETLKKTIKGIVANVYSESMFVDETKEVILTIEMNDSYSYEKYQKEQEKFQKEINIIIENYHPHLHVKPSSTTIAIDIKPVESGKKLGAKKIIDWLSDQGESLKNFNFVCFGDSLSDLDMSDFFYDKNFQTIFIYVGDKKNIKRLYPVILTKRKYNEGTFDYLNKLS